MDPISAGLLVAIATGAAGEAGRQLWAGLGGLVTRRTAIEAGERETSATITGSAELASLNEAPDDLERAQALSNILARRAQVDEAFRAGLMQWHQQAQALRTGDGETTNAISGGTQNGPILQGRDFSGINFNGPSQK
ncbi:hypothetical protein [Streptomyces sp. NPDC006610]|uniref:hypothetical protein n=1 Tax=Streptomyces sp. NPDC006610 TaxID=3154584 RepID=UPI0033A3F9BA